MTSEIVLIRVSPDWRVVDDPLQYILQRRFVRRKTVESWQSLSFCQTREGLLSNIREQVTDPDPQAIEEIGTWPDAR